MAYTHIKTYCRSCHIYQSDYYPYCPECGAADVIKHHTLSHMKIAHIDCDSFYAAVEKRDNPQYSNAPVIVGGEYRGVVAAACYIARIYGVRSAMPIHKALNLCPKAVIIKPNMAKYKEEGLAIRARFKALTPAIEPLSLDEAYLDFHYAYDTQNAPVKQLIALQNMVYKQHGLTISVGLSSNKLLAKIASDIDKPNGFTVIDESEAPQLLAEKPTSILWGVGPKTAEKLASYGMVKVKDIQQSNMRVLQKICGNGAKELYQYAHGKDYRKIAMQDMAKSISSETTLDVDTASPSVLAPIIQQQAAEIARKLQRSNLHCYGVSLKVKTTDHKIMTRSKKHNTPLQQHTEIAMLAQDLWVQNFSETPIRLIGVTLQYIEKNKQP